MMQKLVGLASIHSEQVTRRVFGGLTTGLLFSFVPGISVLFGASVP